MLNFARVSVEFRVAEVYVRKIQLIANISQQIYIMAQLSRQKFDVFIMN